jgi:hypothetical protein
MPNNLQLYHKMKLQPGQWLPLERSPRLRRNMTWFLTNLYLSGKNSICPRSSLPDRCGENCPV